MQIILPMYTSSKADKYQRISHFKEYIPGGFGADFENAAVFQSSDAKATLFGPLLLQLLIIRKTDAFLASRIDD